MRALNWRLDRNLSSGIAGEIGVHQFDVASWFLKGLPLSVTGYGAAKAYKDGRAIADTVQCLFEFPESLRFSYEATLGNSFDDSYELFMGTTAAVMLRDQRAWMFKEVDSDMLGWEPFARKDDLNIGIPANGSGLRVGTGIALVADASKQVALGKQHFEADLSKTSVYQACDGFLQSIRAGKRVSVKEASVDEPNPPVIPDALLGYQATVVALKANEAIANNSRIVYQPDWFNL